MKKIAPLALLAVLALSGCTPVASEVKLAEYRLDCLRAGGEPADAVLDYSWTDTTVRCSFVYLEPFDD